MFIDQFSRQNGAQLSIGADQASDFAKTVSNDFNPIHDPGNRRFCVPGDLLFALAVERYGLAQSMQFHFSGLVSADTILIFPFEQCDKFQILDGRGKEYLHVSLGGERVAFSDGVEALVRAYVRFSGQNFPHILVPLMTEQNVMINAQRPLIIYQSMSLQLDQLNLNNPTLKLSQTTLKIDGKRGDAHLHFDVLDGATLIGRGVKHLILSGLRPFEQGAVDIMVSDYLGWQSEHSYL
ncbi:MAG: hypothetical protein ACI8WL_000413 [Polaribacter sp.]|jgi:hypothetical protein|tara:strand:+ start:7119 stop:7829 length:711 start_codon:yes stop_codon:yes gene_type:complete